MNFKYLYKKNFLLPLILSLLFFLTAILFNFYYVKKNNYSNVLNNFEKVLHKKENNLDKILYEVKIRKDSNVIDLNNDKFFNNLFHDYGFVILIYKNDTLTYWSDNSVPINNIYDENTFKNNFNHFDNGWFEIRKLKSDRQIIIGLLLIKNDYRYQNDYLVNNFQKDFNIPNDATVKTEKCKYNVFSYSNKFLFSINFNKSTIYSENIISFLFILYLIGFLFFILFLINIYKSFKYLFPNDFLFALSFTIDVLIIRFLIFYFKIPHILYESKLFSPYYYASSNLLPSLGDLLINSIILLIISFFIFKNINLNNIRLKKNSIINYIIIFLSFFITFILFGLFISLYKSLIINSNISLNLNNILNLSYISFISLFIISTLVFSVFFLSLKFCELSYKYSFSFKNYFYVLLFISFIVYFIFHFYTFNIFCLIIIFAFIISYWFFKSKNISFLSFQSIAFYLILFSILSTYILNKYNKIKEKENRKSLAIKLSTERDKIAEFKFKNIENEIYSDKALTNLIIRAPYNENYENKVINILLQNYFTGFWDKYDFQITICNKDKNLEIQPNNYIINCDDYFNNIISNIGESTSCKDLFYINDGYNNVSYLATLHFYNDSVNIKNPVSVYIDINSKNVPKDIGYPELLIDKNANINIDLSNYSYAVYENNELIKNVGKYFYSKNLSNNGSFINSSQFFEMNGYNHLLYNVNNNVKLIISKKNEGFIYTISPFSYLLVFFSIYLLIFIIVCNPTFNFKKLDLSFKKRLQLSIILIILVSFIFIGISTLIYINKLNYNKNINILSEKTHSILIEIQHKLYDVDTISPEMNDYLSTILTKFSNVFFTDINIYDLNGNLLASSRPEIFKEGLVSEKMNALAYTQLLLNNKTLFIQKENIGNYKFLSSYVPFRNDQNKLIAYLNLPYFSKQSVFRKEISTFLITYINIYIILIGISIYIALVISNYITRPLQLISTKLSRLKLGKTNEKIEWEKKDEIGNLIIEFNRMVDELSKSAELLAKSERESAWREMAKQVAHEIKNPLTPMKLSIQYLQKAWNDNVPDWDERLKRFSKTIIEQINSLSEIATEFSDFAKMPQSNNEKIEISNIIVNTIELYKEYPNIKFSFNKSEDKRYYIFGDRKQMLRVFINLIKNSIQAIGISNNGIIDISIESKNNSYIIKISDNGTGIPKDRFNKIFFPNFTTKSSGMGLGLAIVKNIISEAGGKIWFESEVGIGTTFYISLPVYNKI